MDTLRGDLLDVSGLEVVFHTYRGIVKALNGVELWLNSAERLGVVGESGCGKSVTSLALMKLIESPGMITAGKVMFNGQDLIPMNEKQMDLIRGRQMATIFQEPVSALNPVMKVDFQILENVRRANPDFSKNEQREKVLEMLSLVGLEPKRVARLYPHELSGGMAQRVMIAMALSASPRMLIADEPTSALDVTIQVQILDLLHELVDKFDYSTLLITHDMGVAAEFCDRIAVMYAGNTVEMASATQLFSNPLHPYTRGLLSAVPKIGRIDELAAIPGTVPDLVHPPSGCRFHPRCPQSMAVCTQARPGLTEISPGHFTACHLYTGASHD